MSKQTLEQVEKLMDIERTDKLFDAAIQSADALGGKKYTNESLKAANLAVRVGNLHAKTATVKMAAVRMSGYQDSMRAVKLAIDKKTRKAIRQRQ